MTAEEYNALRQRANRYDPCDGDPATIQAAVWPQTDRDEISIQDYAADVAEQEAQREPQP